MTLHSSEVLEYRCDSCGRRHETQMAAEDCCFYPYAEDKEDSK